MKLQDDLVETRRKVNESIANPNISVAENPAMMLRILDFTDAAIAALEGIVKDSPKRHDADCGYAARQVLCKLDEEV